MRLSICVLCACLFGLTASAQGLSEAMVKRIKENPTAYVEDAALLIHGYGGPQGIDAGGLEEFVALERAAARASALRRMHAADLDGDSAVTGPELAVAARAASARQRGRLLRALEAADADADGTASGAEIGAYAQAQALADFDEGAAQAVRAILGFDADGNGLVTVPEVQRAVDRVAGAA